MQSWGRYYEGKTWMRREGKEGAGKTMREKGRGRKGRLARYILALLPL